MPTIPVDRTDRKILDILQKEGRLSNLELAERIALSPSPCLRRLKRLEESGVIRQYVALDDSLKVGLGLLAYVSVKLEKRGEGVRARGAELARGGGLLFHDRRSRLSVAGACGGSGALLALRHEFAAQAPRDYRCEVQLRAGTREGHDGP